MKIIHETNRIYGIDENGKVLAEITFPKTEPGVYTIDHTIVDSSLQGQGIAGKLVQAAVDDIKSMGEKYVQRAPMLSNGSRNMVSKEGERRGLL